MPARARVRVYVCTCVLQTFSFLSIIFSSLHYNYSVVFIVLLFSVGDIVLFARIARSNVFTVILQHSFKIAVSSTVVAVTLCMAALVPFASKKTSVSEHLLAV